MLHAPLPWTVPSRVRSPQVSPSPPPRRKRVNFEDKGMLFLDDGG